MTIVSGMLPNAMTSTPAQDIMREKVPKTPCRAMSRQSVDCLGEFSGHSQRPAGYKGTWEHLEDQMAQVNTLRTVMISDSVITWFPKELQRTINDSCLKRHRYIFAGLTEETSPLMLRQERSLGER